MLLSLVRQLRKQSWTSSRFSCIVRHFQEETNLCTSSGRRFVILCVICFVTSIVFFSRAYKLYSRSNAETAFITIQLSSNTTARDFALPRIFSLSRSSVPEPMSLCQVLAQHLNDSSSCPITLGIRALSTSPCGLTYLRASSLEMHLNSVLHEDWP